MLDWKAEVSKKFAGMRLEPAHQAEMIEEMAQHLEDRYQELINNGLSNEEAANSL